MVQHKPTPEEQLLKLIENPGGGKGPSPVASGSGAATPGVKKKGLPDFGKLAGIFSYFRNSMARKTGPTRKFEFALDIKFVNRVLMALVISSVIYLGIDFFVLKPAPGNFLSQVATSERVYPVFQESLNKATRDFPNYEKAIQKRNPFMPPGMPAPSPKAGEEPAPAQAPSNAPLINQMIASLKLVGISWGDEPLAMIEDAESTRTYFVKKGGEVKGMKVQDISKEKVTLTYEGQEAELF